MLITWVRRSLVSCWPWISEIPSRKHSLCHLVHWAFVEPFPITRDLLRFSFGKQGTFWFDIDLNLFLAIQVRIRPKRRIKQCWTRSLPSLRWWEKQAPYQRKRNSSSLNNRAWASNSKWEGSFHSWTHWYLKDGTHYATSFMSQNQRPVHQLVEQPFSIPILFLPSWGTWKGSPDGTSL